MKMEEAKKVPETSEETKAKTKTKNKAPKKADKEVKAAVKTPAKKPAVRKDAGAASNMEGVVARAKKFLRGAYAELKKVNWLGRKELVTFTGVVLVSVLVVGAAIFVVDSMLSNLLSLIIK